jgi:D-alanine-D-alanine ligase
MTPHRKVRIGVLLGGRSGEHEVSLMSARSVLSAMDPDKYDVTQIGIDHRGVWWTGDRVLEALEAGNLGNLSRAALSLDPGQHTLYALRSLDSGAALEMLAELDVVFPVLHGTFGEDGTLQGLLEMADLAYVGAGVLGSSVGMDKGVFKSVMRAEGIPVVDWIITTRKEIRADIDAVMRRAMALGDFPLFVKPANLGSSVGVSRCLSASDLMEGLFEAARFDRRVLIERGVPDPREIEVSVLGNETPIVSVPGEIDPSREFYSYEAKYIDGSSGLFIPAPLSDALVQQVQDLALRAYRAIDCAGMARVDFLLDESGMSGGSLYLSELNTIPGFTQISMYPKLWEASGLPYPQLVDRLIELALERKAERDQTERRYRQEEG